MYSGLALGKQEENLELNFRVKITCSKHSKEYIVNFCKSAACAHNPLSCYKCLTETPDHLIQHHEDIVPIHEHLSTLMYSLVNGLIDKSDILNVNELEFQKKSYQRTRDIILRERGSCECYLNELKYSIIKEIENIKYSILQYYDKYNDDVKRAYESYTSCFEKGKGQDLLSKYGDLKKTLDKFNKVNSEKAQKIIEDIKLQQESVRKAKFHLKGFHESLIQLYDGLKPFNHIPENEVEKMKGNVIRPIVALNEELAKFFRTDVRGIWGESNAPRSYTQTVQFEKEKEKEKEKDKFKEKEKEKDKEINKLCREPPETKGVHPQNMPIKALKQPDSSKPNSEEYMKNTEIDLIYDI